MKRLVREEGRQHDDLLSTVRTALRAYVDVTTLVPVGVLDEPMASVELFPCYLGTRQNCLDQLAQQLSEREHKTREKIIHVVVDHGQSPVSVDRWLREIRKRKWLCRACGWLSTPASGLLCCMVAPRENS